MNHQFSLLTRFRELLHTFSVCFNFCLCVFCSVVVSEAVTTPAGLLSLSFFDGDMQTANRESTISVTMVTGRQTSTNELINLGGESLMTSHCHP